MRHVAAEVLAGRVHFTGEAVVVFANTGTERRHTPSGIFGPLEGLRVRQARHPCGRVIECPVDCGDAGGWRGQSERHVHRHVARDLRPIPTESPRPLRCGQLPLIIRLEPQRPATDSVLGLRVCSFEPAAQAGRVHCAA